MEYQDHGDRIKDYSGSPAGCRDMCSDILKQNIQKRRRERELLERIAALAGLETAEAAAGIYAAEKHAYSFDGYLFQLSRLDMVLTAGVLGKAAVEEVDSCADEQEVIRYYRGQDGSI